MAHQNSIIIEEEIIEKSYRCNQDFSCKSKTWQSCSNINENNNDIIILLENPIDENKMLLCNYHLPFGGENYCTCPARFYIYKKFNI